MGILHDALAALKTKTANAVSFADPRRYIDDVENEYRGTVADTVHAIGDRVGKLEAATGEPPDLTALHLRMSQLEGRTAAIEQHAALSVPQLPGGTTLHDGIDPPPPVDNAFVAPGCEQFTAPDADVLNAPHAPA